MTVDPTEPEPTPTEQPAEEQAPQPRSFWHRKMGVLFHHCLRGQPVDVYTEYDVNIKENRLDIMLLKKRKDAIKPVLADGLNDLRKYNLISYKSFRESFNIDALEELVSYSILFRKEKARNNDLLLLAKQVRVIALSTMKPVQILNEKRIKYKSNIPGVYNLRFGTVDVRLIAIQELAEKDTNGNFFLFSGVLSQIQYGWEHHTLDDSDFNGILRELLEGYKLEGISMANKPLNISREEVERDFQVGMKKLIKDIPAEVRTEGLTEQQLLEALDRLRKQKASTSETATQAEQPTTNE